MSCQRQDQGGTRIWFWWGCAADDAKPLPVLGVILAENTYFKNQKLDLCLGVTSSKVLHVPMFRASIAKK